MLLNFAITNVCLSNDQYIKIVGLSKHKVVIMDDSSSHKVLNIGDITNSGLQLMSSSSSAAVFKDEHGQLISMGISDEISAAYSSNQDEFNTETIELNKNNQYLTTINISGKDVNSIIDTGANFITLNKDIATQLGLDYKHNENKIVINTASDKTAGYKVVLPLVKLGNIELINIDAVVIDSEHPDTTLIGMSFLKNLDLQYSGNHVKIKKHPEQHKPAPQNINKLPNNTK